MTLFNDDWTIYHCKQGNESIRDIVHKDLVTVYSSIRLIFLSIDYGDYTVAGILLPAIDQDVVIDQIVVGISDEVKRAWIRYRISISSLHPAKRISGWILVWC